MKIYLFRHAATKGNLEKRYVGCTDEDILEESKNTISKLKIDVDKVVASPLVRCIQTAKLFFPTYKYEIIDSLKECDFGDFEYKNYKELNGNTDYQNFINSNGTCGFPNGESREQFQNRCIQGFKEVIERNTDKNSMAFVVHGGTIMAILDKFSNPHKDYYDWQIGNGHGFSMELSIINNEIQCSNIREYI